jgi:hypothetical protein
MEPGAHSRNAYRIRLQPCRVFKEIARVLL